jgi:hypothetical protein
MSQGYLDPRAVLYRLIEEYVATLPDNDRREFYGSSREAARRELDRFVAWFVGETVEEETP